jgi:hypothetical protein
VTPASGFRTATTEYDSHDPTVEGAVPDWLSGTLGGPPAGAEGCVFADHRDLAVARLDAAQDRGCLRDP